MMDSAEHCIVEGEPGEVASGVVSAKILRVEELRKARGRGIVYNYSRDELIGWSSNSLCPLLLGYAEETTAVQNISLV
jgi:hypothetical protein